MIAEHAAPALVAVALEGLLAGSMIASRVSLAFRAERALPSLATSVKSGEKTCCL